MIACFTIYAVPVLHKRGVTPTEMQVSITVERDDEMLARIGLVEHMERSGIDKRWKVLRAVFNGWDSIPTKE